MTLEQCFLPFYFRSLFKKTFVKYTRFIITKSLVSVVDFKIC